LTGLGIKILPAVTDIVQWVNGFIGEIKKNKWLSDLLSGAALGLAGLAVASKITKAFDAVKSLFGASKELTMIELLREIAHNTAHGASPYQSALGLLSKVGLFVGKLGGRGGAGAVAAGELGASGLAVAGSDYLFPGQKTTDIKNFSQVVPALMAQGWSKSEATSAASKFSKNFKDAFIDNLGNLQGFAGTYGAHATYKEYMFGNRSSRVNQVGQVVNGKVTVAVH
jgi:hypothetical protein